MRPAGTTTERRPLTVMFHDLVGSTELSARLDPEDIREIIGAYQRCVTEVVTRLGGFVARYMGDGALVYFGYPHAQEDDAERAIQAGLQSIEAVSHLHLLDGYKPQIRVGIASGLVVIGDIIGTGDALGQDVAGETPNLAARLQAVAAPNMVVIAAGTRRLVGGLFEYHDLGSLDLKGFSEPVQVWQVLGRSATTNRFEAQRDSRLNAIVGREVELEVLSHHWRLSREGQGQVVLLSGEPGIGKSRLTAALLDRLRSEQHARLRYFCSPHQQGSPLDPCIRQLEHAAGFLRRDSPARKLEKLANALAPITETPADIALMADLLSLPFEGHYPKLDLPAQKLRQKTMEALLRQLELLSRRSPVLMIFEDAHWADPTSRELLDLVVQRLVRLPILLIVTFRPEFQVAWSNWKHVTNLTLEPLSRQDCLTLVQTIDGGAALPREIVDDLIDRTDGVPLFLEELTKAVLESGPSDATRRSVAARPPPRTSAVPATLHASLLARLDRLERAKEIAQIGAAIGREFSDELVAIVAGKPEEEVRPEIQRLVDAGLVLRRGEPPQATYVFKHVLVQDAAYGAMLRDTRRTLHQKIARALEGAFQDVVAMRPELLAHHCTEGGLNEKAIGYWLAAGQQALARSAMPEAISRLDRGLQVIRGLPAEAERDRHELDFLLALGLALIATKGYTAQRTIESFTRARELCDRLGQPPQLVSVLHGQWTQALMQNEMVLAQRRAEELFALGDPRNDALWKWMGCRFSGVTGFARGNFAGARTYLERGLGLYDAAQRSVHKATPSFENRFVMLFTLDEGHVVTLAYLSWVLLYLGHIEQAYARRDAALEATRRVSHAYSLAHALNGFAYIDLALRRPQSALRHLDRLDALIEEHSIAYYRGMAAIWRGWCMAALGETKGGLEIVGRGLSAYRATGTLLYVPVFLRLAADVYRMAGRPAQGLAQLDEAAELVEASDARGDEAEMHRLRGELLLELCNENDAEKSFQTALDVARRQSAKLFELRAATSLARLWHRRGRRAEACNALRPVCSWFTEGLDIEDLADAKALLFEASA